MHAISLFKWLFILSITGVLGLCLLDPLGYQSYAAGTTYDVATNGSDSNRGTLSQPFRTIQKAANTVNPGDTVIVRDGVDQAPGDAAIVDIRRSGTADNENRSLDDHHYHRPCCLEPLALIYSKLLTNARQDSRRDDSTPGNGGKLSGTCHSTPSDRLKSGTEPSPT